MDSGDVSCYHGFTGDCAEFDTGGCHETEAIGKHSEPEKEKGYHTGGACRKALRIRSNRQPLGKRSIT